MAQSGAFLPLFSKVLRESKFKEHGRITPGKLELGVARISELIMTCCRALEEFIAAGDFLTYKFPVWTWYGFFGRLVAICSCSYPQPAGRKETDRRHETFFHQTNSTL